MRRLLGSLVPRSIRGELMLVFAILTVTPATVVNFYYASRVSRLAERDVLDRGRASVVRVADEVGRLFAQTSAAQQALMGQIVSLPLFSRYSSLSLLERYQLRRLADQGFYNLIWVYPVIRGIYVVNWDGEYYSSRSVSDYNHEAFMRSPWIETARSLPRETVVVPPHDPPYTQYAETGQRTISLVRSVNFQGRTGQETYLQIDVDYGALYAALGVEGSSGPAALVLVGSDGRVVGSYPFAPEDAVTRDYMTLASRLDDVAESRTPRRRGDHILVEVPIKVHGLRLLGFLSAGPLLEQMAAVRRATVAIGASMVLVSLLVSVALAGRITRPIREMIGVMGSVARGDFSVRLPEHRNVDLKALTAGFNGMVDHVNLLMNDIVEKETERTQAELRALQARINPHFLYNTLDVIRGIALAHGDHPVVEMVEAVAHLFRYSTRQEGVVTLERELGHVQSYLSIQRHRYGDRFEVSCEVSPELLSIPVPPLILQPLVENCFSHGFRLRRRGRIQLRARRDDGTLRVCITDDGVGMDQHRLDEVSRSLDEPVDGENIGGRESIGIRNVHRRIRLHCGPDYGIRIASREGSGTTVEVAVPLESS